MPYITAEGKGGPPQPGFFGGWLGRAADPLFMLRDPNAPGFGLPELSPGPDVSMDRLHSRKDLIHHFEGAAHPVSGASGHTRSADRALQDMGTFQAKAFDL